MAEKESSGFPPPPILVFPHKIFRQKTRQVTSFDSLELRKLIHDLDWNMKNQKHGIGIAAPQIGSNLRVALVDLSRRLPGGLSLVLINPEMTHQSDEILSREGCMSLPDYRANIKRYQRIDLKWHDMSGKVHKKSFQGLEAICIQHEVDHLEGMLFIDRVANLKRDMIPRKPTD